jgi:hypothetical protein
LSRLGGDRSRSKNRKAGEVGISKKRGFWVKQVFFRLRGDDGQFSSALRTVIAF